VISRFVEAGQAAEAHKAIDYATRAGTQAIAMLAYKEATRYYELALQVLESQAPGDAGRRCKLLMAFGGAQTKAGEFGRAMETWHKAVERARQLGAPEELAHAALGFEEASWRPGLPGGLRHTC
jgi:uncharacterized protein HemY